MVSVGVVWFVIGFMAGFLIALQWRDPAMYKQVLDALSMKGLGKKKVGKYKSKGKSEVKVDADGYVDMTKMRGEKK